MNFYAIKRRYKSGAFQRILLVMKLIVILLTTAIMQVSAGSYAQRITLNERKTPLIKVIDKIRLQSGYDFIYNDFDLKGAKDVTIHINNMALEEGVERCLEGQDLTYEIKEKTIVLKRKEKSLFSKLSDLIHLPITVKGVITDEKGIGLPGAIIRVKDGNNHTIANSNGEFSISADEGTILLISFIGYKPQEVLVPKDVKKLVITLEQDISKLDEVSVEGYRQGSQRIATSSITKVDGEELMKQPVLNPLQALIGRVPGMVVTQGSGVPGARLNVQIRGRANFDNLLTSDQPLFIIDGVPMAAGNDKVNNLSGPFGPATTDGLSAFAGLNTSDIESISVLKDADATAIYGSRGANGVVLITTKKGKAGKMKMDANVYSGVSVVSSRPQMLNTQQYLEMRNEAFTNDKITKNNSNAYDLTVWDPNRYTDFSKLLVGNTAHTNDAQISLTGGDKYTQYRLGSGYHRESTVWPGDMYSDRGSLNFNVFSMSANEKFTANISGNYSINNSNLTALDLASAVVLPPNYRVYDDKGNLSWNEGGINDGKDNPLAQLKQQYLSKMSNLNVNLMLNYKLLKNLTLRSSIGYNSVQNDEKRLTPIGAQNPTKPNLGGSSNFGNNQLKDWIAEPQIEYNGMISKGKLNILGGATYSKRTTAAQTIIANGYTSDDLLGSLKAAPLSGISATNNATQYNYQAFFGRINYNWEDKYILNFTGRRDGSSRFGPDYRFSNFGAIGGAWVFTNEELLKKSKILSYGKLRASYGTTGNDQIGEYSYLDSWSSAGNYTDSATLYPTKLYNPDLHWERNNKLEIGLELGFFKDRILFTGSVYQNISSDPLVTYPLPKTTGFSSIVENLDGVKVQNRGLELTLTTRNLQKSTLKWSTDFNLTLPKNTLKQFPNLSTSSYATKYVVGESLNRIFAAQYTGVDPATGLYTVKDVNGDKLANVSDYGLVGTSDPKYYGGLNNDFSYKKFSLSFFFQFTKQLGRDWRISGLTNPPGTMYNTSVLALDRWQQPGDNTDVQKFTTQQGAITGTSGYYAMFFSSRTYTDASYIRLKNVYFSYTLPSQWLSTIHINSLRLFLQGQNLFVITPYKGGDPEVQRYTSMAPLRTVTGGIQLTL